MTFIDLLDELNRTIGKMNEDYISNPWRNCKLEILNFEYRHKITVEIKRILIPRFNKFTKNIYLSNAKLGLNRRKETLKILYQIYYKY